MQPPASLMPRHYQGYTAPTRNMPQWRAAYLVFQGGVPNLRTGSLTGGGQIFARDLGGRFQPVLKSYSTPVTNKVAGGQVVALPAFLQALFGGVSGSSSS